MTVGGGIATAGWFIAFVYACTISQNTAVGVVIFGLLIAGYNSLRPRC